MRSMGHNPTVVLHVVKAHCDAPIELFYKPENAVLRFNQLKSEWGEDSPCMDEVEVTDTRPEWRGTP